MGILDFFNKKENKDKYIKWLKKNAGERYGCKQKRIIQTRQMRFSFG